MGAETVLTGIPKTLAAEALRGQKESYIEKETKAGTVLIERSIDQNVIRYRTILKQGEGSFAGLGFGVVAIEDRLDGNGKVARISSFYPLPDRGRGKYEHQGIGGALLEQIEKDGVEFGAKVMIVRTLSLEGNSFYKKQGFSLAAINTDGSRVYTKAIGAATLKNLRG